MTDCHKSVKFKAIDQTWIQSQKLHLFNEKVVIAANEQYVFVYKIHKEKAQTNCRRGSVTCMLMKGKSSSGYYSTKASRDWDHRSRVFHLATIWTLQGKRASYRPDANFETKKYRLIQYITIQTKKYLKWLDLFILALKRKASEQNHGAKESVWPVTELHINLEIQEGGRLPPHANICTHNCSNIRFYFYLECLVQIPWFPEYVTVILY